MAQAVDTVSTNFIGGLPVLPCNPADSNKNEAVPKKEGGQDTEASDVYQRIPSLISIVCFFVRSWEKSFVSFILR